MSIELGGVAATPRPSIAEWIARKAENLRERLAKGLVADSVQIGFRRPAIRQEELPPAPLPLSVRKLAAQDIAELLPANTRGLDRAEQGEIAMRRQLAALLPDCGYAVVDETAGRPCFLQWLAGHEDNAHIARLEGLPQLEPHQMLAEGAYVPPSYRGQRLATAAAMLALSHAARLGATEIVTFIGETNTPSVRAAARAGFAPFAMHVRRHLLFGLIEYDRFRPLPEDHHLLSAKS